MSTIDKEQQAKDVLCFLASRCGCTFKKSNSFAKENTNDFCASVYTLPIYSKTDSMMLWPKIVVFRPSYADYLEECLHAAREDDIFVTEHINISKFYAFANSFKLFMHKGTTLEQILLEMDMNTPVA